MSQIKACHCVSNRRCDPCAERDLDLLIERCKADPAYQAEEALRDTIIIDPRPEARESRGGFHRRTKVAEREAAEREASAVPTEEDVRYISARVAAYREPEGETLTWCCPGCGPLAQQEVPLLDESGIAHCPRVGCDAVVKLTATK